MTSRNRLAGLDGAQSLFLDVLSVNEGTDLFARVAGAARTTDRDALRCVVEACGRHPLALQLLAGRYRHRDSWDLDHLRDRLTQAHDPLDEFDAGLVRAFHLSYAELTSFERRLFRCLALHPGTDITLEAAAALMGSDVAAVRRGVEELLDSHLLVEVDRERSQLHDLVRAFGRQVCLRDEPEAARRSAVQRLLAYYLRGADRADRIVHPRRRRLPVACDPPGTAPLAPRAFNSADEASVWLALERANLLAAARTAASEEPSWAASFAHVLAFSLKSWGVWEVAAELHGVAVSALRSVDDRQGLAQALTEHADVLAKESPEEAFRRASEALALFAELQDDDGRADALIQVGRAQLAAGRGAMALQALDAALLIHRAAGNRHGEAEVLKVRGVALHLGGRRSEARDCFLAMLAIHQSLDDLHGQLQALNNLGEIHRLAGRHEEARVHYEQSLALLRRIGGRQEQANLYNNLGIVCQAAGETDQALSYFHQALSSYRASHDAMGEADTLISLGAGYVTSNRHDEALAHYTEAERIAVNIGNPDEQQAALTGMGTAHRRLNRFDLAEAHYSKALSLAREADIPLGVAGALDGLARVAMATRRTDTARAFSDEAVTLYDGLGETEKARSLRACVAQPDDQSLNKRSPREFPG